MIRKMQAFCAKKLPADPEIRAVRTFRERIKPSGPAKSAKSCRAQLRAGDHGILRGADITADRSADSDSSRITPARPVRLRRSFLPAVPRRPGLPTSLVAIAGAGAHRR